MTPNDLGRTLPEAPQGMRDMSEQAVMAMREAFDEALLAADAAMGSGQPAGRCDRGPAAAAAIAAGLTVPWRSANAERLSIPKLWIVGDIRVGEWTQLSEMDGPAGFLKVRGRRYRYPDGNEDVWDILVGGTTVAIIALTEDDQVVLARQYRPGPGRILLELP
ncbi:MAG: hypothetical protein ACRDRT_10970, partial [Pseudonocardiaceae bacterium]